MPRRLGLLAALAPIAFVIGVGLASGYVLYGPSWRSGSIVMHLHLGSPSGRLTDGSTSWGQAAESALAEWNRYIRRVEFQVVRDSTREIRSANRVSNVFWSSTVYGREFGDHSGWYLSWLEGGDVIEADVIFNTNFKWDSYRGPVRRSAGDTVFDLRRIALHEFGHVLGLDHPFEHGQNVRSIMNYDMTIETVQSDDAQGVGVLYGSSTPTPSNRSPTVTASCDPCTVRAGQTSTLRASASDPDGDALSYQWTASLGTFSNASVAAAIWTAPSQTGSVTATVTVQDGRGGRATATVTLQVVPRDRLQAGSALSAGQSLVSTNARYRLLYQGDGNLVLYDDVDRVPLWSTGTTSSNPGQAILQGDGNFVIYTAQGVPLFSTATPGNPNASLVVQNDGNVVLYRSDGQVLWSRSPTLTPPSSCSTTSITVGQTVTGALLDSDCAAPHRSESRADLYSFQGSGGQSVTITMTASFDTYLVLVGPAGNVVAENDDSDGTDSRISVQLLISGNYTIEATAYSSGDRGGYTLTAR